MSLVWLYLVNTLVIVGFYNAANYDKKEGIKGGLFFVVKYGNKIFNEFWRKPFYDCISCMASVHSLIPYWLFMYVTNCININSLMFYPFYILSLSGILVLIDAIWENLIK